MTPLQRSAIVLLGALALTGGVAVAAPEEPSRSPRLACEEALERDLDGQAYPGIAFVCAYSDQVPREAWPPGAQEPAGGHPEIQIIR